MNLSTLVIFEIEVSSFLLIISHALLHGQFSYRYPCWHVRFFAWELCHQPIVDPC